MKNKLSKIPSRDDEIIADFEKAIENGNIDILYQSIHDSSGNIVKYEILTRIKNSKYNIKEHTDSLISKQELGLLKNIIYNTLSSRVDGIYKYDMNFSVNFEYYDIIDENIISYLEDIAKSGFETNKLTIELIENVWHNEKLVIKNLKRLKDLGYEIAIDDFGSSSSNIQRFELLLDNGLIDTVKLDGDLVKSIIGLNIRDNIYDVLNGNIEDKDDGVGLITHIILLCKRHNIKIIAEYVEDLYILEKLKSLGVDFFQGYHFGKPKENIGDIL